MMDRFLLDLFRTPESQRDPYAWGCVFGSHMAFGLVGWIFGMLIFSDPQIATKFTIFFYFTWELGQLAIKRTMSVFWDCLLDLTAWASVSFCVYELWMNNIYNAGAYAVGSVVIMMVGIFKRLKR